MLYIDPELLRHLRTVQDRADTLRERVKSEIAVRPKPRSLNRRKLDHFIEGAMVVLRTGVPSLFQYEAACRHGLRRVLVEQGWRWADADAAANVAVAEALRRLGAVRPTWYEGQAEYLQNVAIDRHFCARCGNPLEEGRSKYCSHLCGTAASKQRNAFFGMQVSLAEYKVKLADRRIEKLKECSKDCDACGKPFLAEHPSIRFCSRKCGSSERVKHGARACEGCGETFIQKNGTAARFCSVVCKGKASRKPVPEAECPSCLSVFKWKRSYRPQVYCSTPCAVAARNVPSITCEEVV